MSRFPSIDQHPRCVRQALLRAAAEAAGLRGSRYDRLGAGGREHTAGTIQALPVSLPTPAAFSATLRRAGKRPWALCRIRPRNLARRSPGSSATTERRGSRAGGCQDSRAAGVPDRGEGAEIANPCRCCCSSESLEEQGDQKRLWRVAFTLIAAERCREQNGSKCGDSRD